MDSSFIKYEHILGLEKGWKGFVCYQIECVGTLAVGKAALYPSFSGLEVTYFTG